MRTLRDQYGVSILYISHDLSAVASLCDRIAILHEGCIVECGTADSVFSNPVHPVSAQFASALRQESGADGSALTTCY